MANNTASNSGSDAHVSESKCVPFDAVRQLTFAHRRLRHSFGEIGSARSAADFDVIQKICDELMLYLQMKEDIFYPALRQASLMPTLALQLDQSIVEHFSVQVILGTLDGQGPGDSLFVAKVRTLERHVIRHVDDEETRLFPLLGDLPLEQLSRQMALYRRQLLSNAGSRIPSSANVTPSRSRNLAWTSWRDWRRR